MTGKRIESGESTVPEETAREGASGPHTLLVLSHEGPAEYALPETGALTVGRGEKADVRIDLPSVSRAHASVEIVDGRLSIRDLGSVNGIRVRGHRPAQGEAVAFDVGDVVEVGQATLLVLARRVTLRPLPSAPPVAADAGTVILHPTMVRLYELVARVAASDINVLILGETGVGKELLAEALHRGSARSDQPLVRVNCAALAPSLVESELFGHEKGAFTGAAGARPGLIEAAHGGTLFLDEVGELPLPLQAKLLRVLEDRQVLRVGAQRARAIDLRFVAATHRDLRAEISSGEFRRDLYYRLNGISLTIPPLRERVVEIGPLASHFLTAASPSARQASLSPAVLAALEGHDWPGNVRELRNAIARAALVAGDRPVALDDLPEEVMARRRPSPAEGTDLRDEIEALERRRIEDALARTQGNQTHAALLLGMPRRTLVLRLKEYGIERKKDRREA